MRCCSFQVFLTHFFSGSTRTCTPPSPLFLLRSPLPIAAPCWLLAYLPHCLLPYPPLQAVEMERGGLCFPRDYPDTDAFNNWALVMFALQRQRYFCRLSIFCVSVYVWCLCLSVRVSAYIPICVRTICRGARQRRVSEVAARPLDRTRGSRGGNSCREPNEVRNLRSAFRAVLRVFGRLRRLFVRCNRVTDDSLENAGKNMLFPKSADRRIKASKGDFHFFHILVLFPPHNLCYITHLIFDHTKPDTLMRGQVATETRRCACKLRRAWSRMALGYSRGLAGTCGLTKQHT